MGGEGSGRKPDMVKKLTGINNPIGGYADGEPIILPDYSGVGAHDKTLDTLDNRYVNVTGDTMTGALTVQGLTTLNQLDVNSTAVLANTLDVTLQATFSDVVLILDDKLQLSNPANTFQYIFSTSAIIADRTITLPLMTADGNMVIDSFGNTFSTKQRIDIGAGTGTQLEVDGTSAAGTLKSISYQDAGVEYGWMGKNLGFFGMTGTSSIFFGVDANNFILVNPAATDVGYVTSGTHTFSVGFGGTELTIAANRMTFNAGASDPYLDWTTSGELDMFGDFVFVTSGSGLPYGACYGKDIAWAQASAAQNTWYLVSDVDMVDGPLNLITHDGNGKLTVTKAGVYKIDMAISMDTNGTNKTLEYGVSQNGQAPVMYKNEFFGAASALQHGSLTRLITCAANDTLELAVRTTSTGTPTIDVNNLSITVVQVGG